jgi:hypothetical protein
LVGFARGVAGFVEEDVSGELDNDRVFATRCPVRGKIQRAVDGGFGIGLKSIGYAFPRGRRRSGLQVWHLEAARRWVPRQGLSTGFQAGDFQRAGYGVGCGGATSLPAHDLDAAHLAGIQLGRFVGERLPKVTGEPTRCPWLERRDITNSVPSMGAHNPKEGFECHAATIGDLRSDRSITIQRPT